MKKSNNNKKGTKWDVDEREVKAIKKKPRQKRHTSKENLKDIAKGNLDYDDYMEMEEWSDSR